MKKIKHIVKKHGWVLFTALVLLVMMGSWRYFIYDFRAKTGLWYRKKMLVYIAPALVAFVLSFFHPRKLQKKWRSLARLLFALLTITLAADVFQRMAWDEPLVYAVRIQPKFILINVSITAVIYMAVWMLIWDSRIAAHVTFGLMYVFGYAYYCVGKFRGTSFKLVDFTSIGTALAVADKYRFPFEARHVFWASFGVALLLIGRWAPGPKSKKTGMRLAKLGCITLACGWMLVLLCTPVLDEMGAGTAVFEANARYVNAVQGALTTLAKEGWELQTVTQRPYEPAQLKAMDERLLVNAAVREEAIQPNVLVIMNESFADLSRLWKLDTDVDPLPYLHSLADSTVSGNLYVSSYGGSTCNTEHSFLTGTIPIPNMSMQLMSTIYGKTPSLAWQMKEAGYTTIAIHPEWPENYSRETYYPLLGLDTFLSRGDFEGAERMRGHVTDQACFEKIIALYETKAADEKLFVFNVTMQNHGSDLHDGMKEWVTLETYTENIQLKEYFNCIRQTDEAFQALCSYFEQQDEPTLILMFGDHQPGLKQASYGKRDDLTNLENQFTEQITPFVIWANYPIEAEYIEAISVNYLAALLVEKGKLPINGYEQWLLETAEKYPVVLLQGYIDAQGKQWPWQENRESWPLEIRQLDDLRYNRLYDAQNRLPALDFAAP